MKEIDVVCAGLNVVNFPICTVDDTIFTRDLTRVSPITLLPGGDAANQAIVLSQMGFKTALLSAQGNDEFGKIMLELLKKYGKDIDVDNVYVNEQHATCVCAMMIRPDGQRHFCSHRGAMDAFSIAGCDLSILDGAKVASIGGLMSFPNFDGEGSEQFFRTARDKGVITIADTKVDIAKIGVDGISGTLRYTDYFFPSYDEASAISGEKDPEKAADIFLTRGAVNVGVKLGADGVLFKNRQTSFRMPAIPCTVVDTTGAGDNFMSGFIAGLIKGWDVKKCCLFGTAAASICVGQVGPNTAVHSFAQVEKIMNSNIELM